MESINLKPLDRVIAFNAREWREAGGDQPDGNAQFFQEAVVLRVYYRHVDNWGSGGWLADLCWQHDGRVSHGHFVSGLEKTNERETNAV